MSKEQQCLYKLIADDGHRGLDTGREMFRTFRPHHHDDHPHHSRPAAAPTARPAALQLPGRHPPSVLAEDLPKRAGPQRFDQIKIQGVHDVLLDPTPEITTAPTDPLPRSFSD